MTTTPVSRSDALARLLAQIVDALATADRLALDATGIALDTARLSVEDALAEASAANDSVSEEIAPARSVRSVGGAVSRGGG